MSTPSAPAQSSTVRTALGGVSSDVPDSSTAGAPLGYTEWMPPAGLDWAIECVWMRRNPAGAASRSRILPDSCADLIFDLSERAGLRSCGGGGLRAIAVGTMTEPLATEVAPGSTILGVRFRPGAALPFFGAPLDELVDRRVDLEELWRHARVERLAERLAERLVECLVDRRAGSSDPADWAAVLGAELRLAGACVPDQVVRAAVRWIVESEGRVRSGELARRLGLSRQTLARRFRRQVGVGPKMLARVVRLRATVARIERAEQVDWAELALDLGFSDQAHLCSELRELAGASPTSLQRELVRS